MAYRLHPQGLRLRVADFDRSFVERLPEAAAVLSDAPLVVHDAVEAVTLHGSRGLRGGARPQSDIDLGLVVCSEALARATDPEKLLRIVLRTTLDRWRSDTRLDVAAIFDRSGCGLPCLDRNDYDPDLCPDSVGCMGLFKIQKGFEGYVPAAEVDCSKMYPLITVWRRHAG